MGRSRVGQVSGRGRGQRRSAPDRDLGQRLAQGEGVQAAEELAGLWRAAAGDQGDRGRVLVERTVPDGMRRAIDVAEGPIVVAGSLYLVGAVRDDLTGASGS